MRISDWSSDVCSSDLLRAFLGGQRVSRAQRPGADRLVAAAACAARSSMRTVTATRYVTPLREGGSLPAIIEADDDGMYVMKFRGAGQGAKALVAEVIAGELARLIGLPIPEIVLVEIDPDLRSEEHKSEPQSLMRT